MKYQEVFLFLMQMCETVDEFLFIFIFAGLGEENGRWSGKCNFKADAFHARKLEKDAFAKIDGLSFQKIGTGRFYNPPGN